jgi:hypothetical protein
MSRSREVYSDGGGSWSRYSSATLWKEPPKARRLKKKEEENATRYIWFFTWTTGTKTTMDGVEGNMELLLSWKTGAEKGRTDASEQYKQTDSKKKRGITDLS